MRLAEAEDHVTPAETTGLAKCPAVWVLLILAVEDRLLSDEKNRSFLP
jgi:hypothetical protein